MKSIISLQNNKNFFDYRRGNRMRSPITRYGGKYYTIKEILPHLCVEHQTFIEGCCGAAHVFFAKEPSPVEVLNDKDGGLQNFYSILRDRECADELRIKLELTPYSREEFYHCMNTWREEKDPVEKARKYWVYIMQSFGGIGVSWSSSTSVSRRGMSQAVSAYLRYIEERIPQAIERLQTVQIESLDIVECIKKYDRETTLFYLDPPYVTGERVAGGYEHDMTTRDHEQLVKTVNQSSGMFLISGFDNEIYDNLNGFEKIVVKEIATRADGDPSSGREYRTEVIWKNF